MFYRLINAQRKSLANKRYYSRECLEILGIPPSVKDNELETKVLNILNKIETYV